MWWLEVDVSIGLGIWTLGHLVSGAVLGDLGCSLAGSSLEMGFKSAWLHPICSLLFLLGIEM